MDILSQLVGCDVSSLKGVLYVGEEASGTPTLEACELMRADGASVLFTSATDWTLQIAQGRYPMLPDWCSPSSSWIFSDLETPLGSSGWQRIIATSKLLNEVGETSGILLEFEVGNLAIKVADVVSFEFSSVES